MEEERPDIIIHMLESVVTKFGASGDERIYQTRLHAFFGAGIAEHHEISNLVTLIDQESGGGVS